MACLAAAAMFVAGGCGSVTGDEDPIYTTAAPLSGAEHRSDTGHSRRYEILDPGRKHLGQTYEQWASDWWRWVFAAPGSTHPLLDTTGQDCHVGQTSEAFFLAGTFGGSAERSCLVPKGKPVFLPLVNTSSDNCGVPPEAQLTLQELKATANGLAPSIQQLELDIDGKVIGDEVFAFAPYLIDVTRFSYVVPAMDSIYDVFDVDFEGRCFPSFSAGYYVMLRLARGAHEIHFSSVRPDFSLDVRYHLEVE